ncbi:MAG: TonB family protein [Brumimicrobium sp.]|nr:TonB family protein [Brumimicrobium sp.]
MIAKKNPRFHEENNSRVYFQLGLLIGSACLLMAFTWKTPVSHSEKITVERTSNVPVIEIMKEEEKPVEIPEVKVLSSKSDVTTVQKEDLSAQIKEDQNKDKNETVNVNPDVKNGDIVGNANFKPDLGQAPDLNTVVRFPNKEAYFKGNWKEYLKNNLVYPESARIFSEEGTVHISFIVEKDGSVTDIRVLNKGKVSKDLEKEAVRVVKNSPEWTPGILNAEYVRTIVNTQIKFRLQP